MSLVESTQKYLKQATGWFRPLLAIVFFLLILDRFSDALRQDWWSAFLLYFSESNRAYLLVLVLMLMPVNWLVESFKWRACVSALEKVSLWLSFRAVLSGVSVSLFMPNRIGEYVGRVFVLQKADRVEAALVTMVAAFSQLLITLLAGAMALIGYRYGWIGSPVSIVFVWTLSAIALFAYYRSSRLSSSITTWRLPVSLKDRISALSAFDAGGLSRLLSYSALRYMVFAVQFLLMLRFFSVAIPLLQALMCVSVTYLLMAVVPTIALTELGVRGAVSVFVFTPFTADVEQVVFASSVLWSINLVLPALAGSLFMLKWRLNRTC